MNRREFSRSACLGGAALASGINGLAGSALEKSITGGPQPTQAGTSTGRRRALMKVGTQHGASDEILRSLAALGVNNICGTLPSPTMDERWSVEGLVKLREHVESFGIRLDMLPLPLSSNYITHAENPNIMLGRSPERDREIDSVCQMIRNVSRAGIPTLKYNMSILGVVRTEPVEGRGGATYSAFDYDKASQVPALTEAGRVGNDDYWERITYFLKRVIPVATECRVRLACHPHDPGMPQEKGYRGVHTVLGNVEGLKRFIQIEPSPYHGLNFCQGTVSVMLKDPGKEIYEVIQYFGGLGKIFNVHFRNIRGGFLRFQETFIDDGDVDMLKALRVYKEVGYDGMVMPDHVPRIPGDAGGQQAFAYSFGYIKALIAAVDAES